MITKQELRKQISALKKEYSFEDKKRISEEIMKKVEENYSFKEASTVMLYYSMNDEVYTHDFIRKWYKKKRLLLPVISQDDIIVKEFVGDSDMLDGAWKVMEPQNGEIISDLSIIDLVIVPGVAFDGNGNRMGRGKGYYDRFLVNTKARRIGICFPFQFMESIPCDEYDIAMDEVITL